MNQHRRGDDKWWKDNAFRCIAGLISLCFFMGNYRLLKIETHSEKIPVIVSELKHLGEDFKDLGVDFKDLEATVAVVKKKVALLEMEAKVRNSTLGIH